MVQKPIAISVIAAVTVAGILLTLFETHLTGVTLFLLTTGYTKLGLPVNTKVVMHTHR